MDLKSTYNKIAEDWNNDHDKDTWWQEGLDAFLDFLPKEATILDVGCGAGIKSRYVADKGYKVTGVDFSEKMIEIAKKNSPELEFEVLDIHELDKYPKMFDAILAQAVLLHFPREKALEILESMKRKLNPNGLLNVAVKGVREDGIEENILKEKDYGFEYERFFSYYRIEELKEYLKKMNMELVWEGMTKAGKTDWLQIIGKNS